MSRTAAADVIKYPVYDPTRVYKRGEYFWLVVTGNTGCVYYVTTDWSGAGIATSNNRFYCDIVSGNEFWLGQVEVGASGMPTPSGQNWDFSASDLLAVPGWLSEIATCPTICYALSSEVFIPKFEIVHIYTNDIVVSVQKFTSSGVPKVRLFNHTGNWTSGQSLIFIITMSSKYSPF